MRRVNCYEEWVLGLSAADVWALLDFSYTRNGLFKGERLIRTLRALVGEIDIEDLDIGQIPSSKLPVIPVECSTFIALAR